MAKDYSAIERARNAAKQARDKNGRFIEMNGTMRYKSGGKTKSGKIIGVSGGYAYFLPPIKNATHRPQPYRIPLNALEMYKPKATLKSKKARDHEKKYVEEQTKLFESKLDPNRRKELEDHKRIVDKAKKEKLDIDTYEVDKDGVDHLKKNDPIEADAKTQALINARLESLADGEKFEIPLKDGFKIEVDRNNGKVTTKVLDSEGRTHSDRTYSEKKSDAEISQEIAKDVARENDTPDIGEETQIDINPADIDGDGIPDIDDPYIQPKWQTTTKASKPSKEDLDVAPVGTTLVSEDGKTIYTKTARRSETRGSQWSRYEGTDGSYKLDNDKVYSDDIADGSAYKRPSEAISEEEVELTPAEKEAREKESQAKKLRKEQQAKLNDREKFVTDASKRGGLTVVDGTLSNALPVSAERNPKTLDLIDIPKSDMSKEVLESLPVGTQLVVKNRNGKNTRVTKMGDDNWYSKKAYKDHLPKGMEQHTLTTEEVFEGLGDTAQVKASGVPQRNRDYAHIYAHRNNLKNKLNGTSESEDDESGEPTAKDIYEEIEATNVSTADLLEQRRIENTISDKDEVGTEYYVIDEDTTFFKMEDGTIESADGDLSYTNAKEFSEDIPQTTQLSYHITRPIKEEIPDTAPIPEKVDVRKLPEPVNNNPNKVKRPVGTPSFSEPNPITSITGSDGVEYELGEARVRRNDVIAELFKRGLIDADTFDPKSLYSAVEGSETGRYYDDGNPIRVGDEVLYNTLLREGAWNNKEYVEVRAVVTGAMVGKGDVHIFPLETVYGKKKGQVKDADGNIVSRPVIETSFGPADILGRADAVRKANLDLIRSTREDGVERSGNRESVNVEGRTGSMDLSDMYTQDAKNVQVGDYVKFRFQTADYNKDGIPYETVFSGQVTGYNLQNQSLIVDVGGHTLNPSIKNTTTADGPDPVRPRDIESLELPEGFRLDSQNRVLSEESAQETEDVRDSIGSSIDRMREDLFGESNEDVNAPSGDAKEDIKIFGDEDPNPEPVKIKREPRKKRNLINSVVSTQQEYDSSIPRYFRDRKETEYTSSSEKATDWSNAPVGSTIRLMGGGFAIKTSSDSWDFRKSSKHLVQRNLSNKKFAETLEAKQDFLDNARTTAPTRKKFLEYNGGKLSPTARPSSRKAPVGSEVDVEGDKLTKTESGWEGDQGVALSDNQLDSLMVNNPEDVKVSKVPVSKIATPEKSVAIQDSIFELNEDGSFSRNDVFSFSPKETISAEEVDTVAGEMSPDFNMVVKDRKDNNQDSWDAVETVSLDSDGNIVLTLDNNSEQTAKKVLADFASRLEGDAVPPRRVVLDESEHFQTVSAYSKPNPDGGYDLVVNPDGVEEKDIASALADGIRQNNATSFGLSPRKYDEKVLRTLVSEEDRSLSYDEILKKLGVRSKRKGSVVAEAFEDVWTNGPDASPVHLNIWKRYASDNEMIALFRKEHGRDPMSETELDKYRKKL